MGVSEGSIGVVVLGLDVWHLQVDIEGAIGFFGPKRQVGLYCMGGEVDLGDWMCTRYFCWACRYSSMNLDTWIRCSEVAGNCSEVYFLRP